MAPVPKSAPWVNRAVPNPTEYATAVPIVTASIAKMESSSSSSSSSPSSFHPSTIVDAEKDLVAATDDLDAKALCMVKTMRKPPAGIDRLFAAAGMLMSGKTKTILSWKDTKKGH